MNNADSEVSPEQWIAGALKGEPERWTPECLAPEQIIALAEKTATEAETASGLAHIALCARCHREYAETVELVQLSAEIDTPSVSTDSPPSLTLASESPAREEASGVRREPPAWRRHFLPGFGFALGAAAASILLFFNWKLPFESERIKLASLLQERDSQRTRAERAEEEKEALARQLAAKEPPVGTPSEEVARLHSQIEKQRIRIARLTESDQALQQMPLPAPAWMRSGEGGATRGGGIEPPASQIVLLRPANTGLETTRPVFECRPVSGATGYRITLEPEGNADTVPALRALSPTRWEVASPLLPGRLYRWSVTAQRKGEPLHSRPATVYILSATEKKQVVEARQRYARNPLALGVIYAGLGMWPEAEASFRLAQKEPINQSVATRWLKEIRERIGP